ncbi:M28 family peptidase [Hymenobacter sediminis]|nr:M28 family peptidase [Hymenobacter sediminis]
MHGRGYVNQGEQKAARYLQQRFEALGLQPLSSGFQQPFSLPINTFPGTLKLRLNRALFPFPLLGNQLRLQPGLDFIAAPDCGPGRLGIGRSLAYLDSTVLTDETARRQFLHLTSFPSTIVLSARTKARLAHYPSDIRQRLDSAAAVITLVPKLTASLAATQSHQIRLEALPHPWLTGANHYAKLPPAATAKIRVDAQLIPAYPTQNVIGYLPGRVQPDSFLIVTAHYDHLGRLGRQTYFPGANDNASGVAMLLELAAYYAAPENRPAYSMVFIAFGAEEAGLVGSRYYVEHPLVPLNRIRFLLNLDLVGTGEEGITVVNGRVFEQAFQQLVQLNTAGRYVPSVAARGRAANSDHYPFSERGVSAFFIYARGGSSAYHDVADQPTQLSLSGFSGIFKLITHFLAQQSGH